MPPFKLLRPAGDGSWDAAKPVAATKAGTSGTVRFRLAEPETSGAVRYEQAPKAPYPAISEIRLAEVGVTDAPVAVAGDRTLEFARRADVTEFGPLGRAPLDTWKRRLHRRIPTGPEPGPLSRAVCQLYPPEDRTILVPGDAPGVERVVRVGPLRHAHLMSPEAATAAPLDVITLRLRVQGLAKEDVLRLRVREPNNPFRDVMKMDFRVKNPAGPKAKVWIEATLDVPDQVILPGQRLWVDLAFAGGAEIVYGRGGSQLVLSCPDATKSRSEFVADQIKFVHSCYQDDAESHPWDRYSWETTSRRFRLTNEQIYLAARAAITVDPLHPMADAYWRRMMLLPYGDAEPPAAPPGAPEWAVLQRELLRGSTRVVRWWIDNRQMADGQLGGHWGDDVETAANWPMIALVSQDPKVLRGLKRIADGIWNDPAQIDKEKGYTVSCYDVEHACEPTVCSQPHMMVLRYGDPEYIERNMRTARNIGEWTGVNARGERLFRSWYFNAKKVITDRYYGCDVPYNTAALRAGNLIAWYNRNPLVTKWLREHAETWLQKCLSEEGGKPKGLIPHEVVFETGKIAGFSGHWSKSVYPGGGGGVAGQFLTCYFLLGDGKYLDHLRRYERYWLGRVYPSLVGGKQAVLPPRGKRWRSRMAQMRSDLALLRGTEKLVTWAEPPTDRIHLPGFHPAMTAYLGRTVSRGAYPLLAASYEGAEEDLAAWVLENTPKGMRLWLYNFRSDTMPLGVRVWSLESGDYEVRLGFDGDRDGRMERPLWTRTMPLARFARMDVALPSRRLLSLEVKQVRRGRPIATRADVGIAARDVRFDAKARAFHVTVHNLGSRDVKDLAVRVTDALGRSVGEARLAALPAPLDLTPKTRTVTVKLTNHTPTETYTILLDPANALPEITEVNNVVRFRP